MYLGLTSKPLPSLPPIRYWSTAQGERFELGGRGRWSALRRASRSSANCCSACWRRTWLMVCFREGVKVGFGSVRGMRQDGRGSGRAAQGDKGLVQAQAQIDDALQMARSEEHTSELQSHLNLVCRLLLEKKKTMCVEIRRLSTASHSVE